MRIPLFLLLFVGWFGFSAFAQEKNASETIQWVSLEELEKKMATQPKRVFIDVYTDWCGWCKVMDRNTFSHPEVARYINKHFYAVKFNAESKDSVAFAGHRFGFMPEYKVNGLAVELLRGKMSYPSTVYIDKDYGNAVAVPGYLKVPAIEQILKYIVEGHGEHTPFDQFTESFQGSWE